MGLTWAELESQTPGAATGARADLALAVADLSVRLTRKRKSEGPCNDTYSALLAWNHHWDAAIAAQRWAMERNKGDEQSMKDMAYRLAIAYANKAMPKALAPGPFAHAGIQGAAARDALIAVLGDSDPLWQPKARVYCRNNIPAIRWRLMPLLPCCW